MASVHAESGRPLEKQKHSDTIDLILLGIPIPCQLVNFCLRHAGRGTTPALQKLLEKNPPRHDSMHSSNWKAIEANA
jgi:hypothetical protein